ncbi:MAG: Fic family protein [Burkholderiales bacterium]|nr:Fic family protein [Burkholderiales bacterium]
MRWNWQDPDWPHFRFQAQVLARREAMFLQHSGIVLGTMRHLPKDEHLHLVVELISTEALKTSEIEGEILDRDSVQSSLRRQFGLQSDARRVPPAEQGIAEMLTDLYRSYAEPLTHESLFAWHRMLTKGRTDIEVGRWRTHGEPMQVVSGPVHTPKVHFEAPPSTIVPKEMTAFCKWFNDTAPGGAATLPALTRASLAHLYFESIHPFEDGNGRIGRAISEKALAQGIGQPSLSALSLTIERQRSQYYLELELANKSLQVDRWLDWFADTVLAAQSYTVRWTEFLIAKTRLLDRLRGQINPRQEKALLRVMREGPDGFKGGLSAGNYQGITGAPPATARRDLAELVELGALRRTGQLRGTRYWLAFESNGKER